MAVTKPVIRVCFLVFLVTYLGERCHGDSNIFNVKQFGAKSDGVTDNSLAFSAAWKAACNWKGQTATLVIPAGTYLTGPVTFEGPCQSSSRIIIQVIGVVKAPSDLNKFPRDNWIVFSFLDRLLLTGGGVFDGQGKSTWPLNVCQKNSACKQFPTSIQFNFVTRSIVRNIVLVNSKQKHIKIFGCRNLHLFQVTIRAPGDSPNTDGITISQSSDIRVYDSKIGTGDDCISILGGTLGVFISNVFCGPGHGISVGSLGYYANERDVHTISITGCTFSQTTNGVRIKTWPNSKSSISASNFTFENLMMKDVSNPIIIDQRYCPSRTCSNQPSSTVKIRDVTFEGIRGTSATHAAVSLLCSEAYPCENVKLRNIDLKPSGNGSPTVSFCSSVKGSSTGIQIPPPCL